MISLTTRAARVVAHLLQAQTTVTVQGLAEWCGASERSIRYDFPAIEDWLSAHNVKLMRKPRAGVWVEGTPGALAAARAALAGVEEPGQSTLLAEDRLWLILWWLFSEKQAVHPAALAGRLDVSRRTAYSDLARVEEWLTARGMVLEHTKTGLMARGDEPRCRTAMDQLIQWAVTTAGAPEGLEYLESSRGIGQGLSAAWGMPILLEGEPEAPAEIRSLVERGQAQIDRWLGRAGVAEITVHLLAALVRIRNGHFVTETWSLLDSLKDRVEWEMARWIWDELASRYRVPLIETELGYLALHICRMSAEACSLIQEEMDADKSREELEALAFLIVEKAGRYLELDLTTDADLLTGLCMHLYGSLEVLRVGLPMRNPLIEEIRAKYPRIHEAARQVLTEVGTLLGVVMPEQEVGWIAMHLGAALERLTRSRRRWKALVVCASGIGTAQLIRARLLSEFAGCQIRISPVRAEADLCEMARRYGADVVVSTVRLHLPGIPVIQVSPLLQPKDLQAVAQLVYEYGEVTEEELLSRCRRSDEEATEEELNMSGPRLAELVRPELIQLDAEVSDPVEAIELAGRLLVRGGAVTERYVGAMVDIYQRLGPYMVLAPGVACPHASPADGVEAHGLAVVVLKRPIPFGSVENDPVQVVIAFASPDYSSHFKALMDLSQVLEFEGGAYIRQAHSVSEVMAILRGHRLLRLPSH